MNITAIHINYYHVCWRKVWLFSHGINMEHTSDVVKEGRLIGESTYSDRAARYTELAIDGIKIDYYDATNKIVHEIKKSDKMEIAHIAQVKYYLWVLEQNGIIGAKGILEYPKQRHTEGVELSDEDRLNIPNWMNNIERIVSGSCPKAVEKTFCKQCSYFDFCYTSE